MDRLVSAGVAQDAGLNADAALLGVFPCFQNESCRAFAVYQTVAAGVEGA